MRPKPSGLTSAEFNVHSFIVKVWFEEEATKNSDATWHGYITHVPSGKKCYLKNLGEITAFIEPYLKAIGNRSDLNE